MKRERDEKIWDGKISGFVWKARMDNRQEPGAPSNHFHRVPSLPRSSFRPPESDTTATSTTSFLKRSSLFPRHGRLQSCLLHRPGSRLSSTPSAHTIDRVGGSVVGTWSPGGLWHGSCWRWTILSAMN